MKVRAEFKEQDSMQVELTIRGSLGEFRKLADQLDDTKWPSLDLKSDIRDVVRKASQVVHAERTAGA
jgi:hypothetical protein